MDLKRCKLCGKVFTMGTNDYCYDCIRKLGDLYGTVHEYMRDHNDEVFDIASLAAGMDIDPVYIKALVDLGYISILLKDDSEDRENRRQLAKEFSREIGKIHIGETGRNKTITYGGEKYSRKK